MTPKTKTRVAVCFLVVGVLFVVLSILIFTIVPGIVRKEIIKNTVIKEGSLVYPTWEEPGIPIYMQFYPFHLTNPAEVIAGTKLPNFQQMGPYTYREHRKKVNITWNGNGTVTYKQIRTWHFDRSRSSGDESDTFMTVNLPLLSVVSSLQRVPDIVKLGLDFLAALNEETIFQENSVRNVSFGYHDKMMGTAMEILPQWFYTDYVGIYGGKNDTDDGTYTVYTGETDWNLTGVIEKYNGSTLLPFWSDDYANMINGSDGTVAPPFLTKDITLPTFQSDVCRSLYGVYGGDDVTPQGIPLWNFVGPPDELANISVNPNNAGFCTPPGNCLGAGLVNLSSCQIVDSFEIPIVISFPHFLYADEKYLTAVTGLHPVKEWHVTEIGLEPQTGIVMKIAKRLQINAFLQPLKDITDMGNLKEVIFPILWVNESALINDELAGQYNSMMLPVRIADVSKYVLLVLGILFVIGSIGYLISHRKRSKSVGETEPLIQAQDRAPLTASLTDAACPSPQ